MRRANNNNNCVGHRLHYVPPDFLVEGQVSGLGTVHSFSLQTTSAHGVILPRDRSDIVKDNI